MKKQIAVSCLVLLSGAGLSAADESSEDLIADNLTVYGVRLDQAETEVGSSITIITADDIKATGVDYVLDAVAMAPGVTINQNGAYGGSASVRIRGATSEQTLVIIDGVVANDPTSPGGGFNFARLDPANIERIEVLKGPQSTLWGSDAIGGVINIITKRPATGLGGNAFAQAGSYGTQRGGASISGADERFDFRLAVSRHSTDGISKADEINGNTEDDSYEATTVSANGGVNIGDARLQAKVLWTDAESEFDSFIFGAQGNVGDGDELSATEELSSNLTLQLPLFGGKLDNQFLLGFADIDRANFNAGAPTFASEGDRLTYRYQGVLSINDEQRLAFGVEREDSESNGEDTSIDGLFALYELQALESLTVTAGVRRDDHERFGAETTGRLTLAYNPSDQLTLRASWGEGFKAPTLFQTTFFCCGATAPNTDLKAESSDAFDIGITYRSADAKGQVGLTYFDQDTTNLITYASGGYENIARASSSGFELDSSYYITEWLEASMNYAFIDAEDGDGETLTRVPKHSGDVALSFNPEAKLSGTLMIRYNGEEQDRNGVVAEWVRVDLSGRYALTDTVELYARVENLFDDHYQQIIGYGAPGLSGYVGARLSF